VRSVDEPLPLTFEIRPGRVVVLQGEPYPGAWIVRSGRFLMEAVDADGRRLWIDVLGQGDLVGGPPGREAEATVQALTEAWVAPAGPAALRDGLARRAHRAASLACALAWERVADRIAVRLTDLADRFGRPVPGGRCLRFPLTQEELAWLTGSNRETVNRALVKLRREGRVAGGGPTPFVVPRSTRRSFASAGVGT
ncbi:MAG TPA: Crp/Fnr family transcriptional regulator, partial [Actinomycetota bacterium]|nr:Crp/Fnr family transcriptional regulator [Actinomycetota bacterium]